MVFNFAVEREIVEVNPVSGVRKLSPERSRDRVLLETEIKALWAALEEEGRVTQGLFRFLLLTAQRSEETRRLEWNQIRDGTWRVPAENTKPGRLNIIPLSPQAVKVLEALSVDGSPFVFPSPSSRGSGPIRWLSHATIRLRRRCGVDFRPHDLRRTAATGMAALGDFARHHFKNPEPQVSLCHSRVRSLGSPAGGSQGAFRVCGQGGRDRNRPVTESCQDWVRSSHTECRCLLGQIPGNH